MLGKCSVNCYVCTLQTEWKLALSHFLLSLILSPESSLAFDLVDAPSLKLSDLLVLKALIGSHLHTRDAEWLPPA